jgi:FlaA1/EpsC-like NDP-sugar epimerase
LILLERSESALFDIHSALAGGTDCVPELADITDSQRLSQVLDQYRPTAVFHAAAFKHVGLLERQPLVALRNNILGTHTLAMLAREHQVDRVVLVSTDKAVEPTNVMGATKRVAERLMEGHALDSSGTRFISVRFGNVLGSSGSVVPIFQRQIAAGGPVTVRDAEVTRYFMSIPEAAGLVLCSGMLGENGDRFILDMGDPVKIMDLAEQMIRLSGKTSGQEIAIEITGLGPGEKQHERLYASDEQLEASTHSKIQRLRGDRLDADAWRRMQSQLALLEALNGADAKAWLQDTLPEYQAE